MFGGRDIRRRHVETPAPGKHSKKPTDQNSRWSGLTSVLWPTQQIVEDFSCEIYFLDTYTANVHAKQNNLHVPL